VSLPRGRSSVWRFGQGVLLLVCALGGTLSTAVSACPHETAGETENTPFAAGCMVRIGDRLLLVRHRFTGKLGIPAGYSSDRESSRCTAYRETLEETGLEVTVHDLLMKFHNGFYLYRCHPAEDFRPSDVIDVPESGLYEINAVLLIDPESVTRNEWRFPEQASEILSLFRLIGSD